MPRRASRRASRRTSRRNSRRNSRRTSRRVRRNSRRTTAAGRIGGIINQIRAGSRRPSKGGLNPDVYRWLTRRASGLYRIGGGGKNPSVMKFKPGTSLHNAMTSSRIAASNAKETTWLVKVFPSGSPKAIVIRRFDKKGKTVFRTGGLED